MKQPNWKNNILVEIKRGDQLGVGGYRDGEIIQCYDADEWFGQPPVISDESGAIFRYELRSKSMKAGIRAACAKNAAYHKAGVNNRCVLDSSDKIYDSVRTKWATGNVVEIVDATSLKTSGVKDVGLKTAIVWTDVRSVSSGLYTVGSAGTYANFVAVCADTAALTGNLTFTLISNITETARALYNNLALNGYALLWTSNTPTLGSISTGWTVTFNHTSQGIYWICTGTGTATVEGFRMESLQQSAAYIRVDTAASGIAYHVRNLMFDGKNTTQSLFIVGGSAGTTYVYNNIFWDNKFSGYAVSCFPSSNTVLVNNTFVNFNGQSIYLYNGANAATNNATAVHPYPEWNGISGSTGEYNASEDSSAANGNWSSGTGNITGIVPGTVFVSLDDTSESFCVPAPGEALDGAQTTSPIPGHTTGIDGNPLNCIGALQIVSGGFFPITFKMIRTKFIGLGQGL